MQLKTDQAWYFFITRNKQQGESDLLKQRL